MLFPVVLNQTHNRARLYQCKVERQRPLVSALGNSMLLGIFDSGGQENSIQNPANGLFTTRLIAPWTAHSTEMVTGSLLKVPVFGASDQKLGDAGDVHRSRVGVLSMVLLGCAFDEFGRRGAKCLGQCGGTALWTVSSTEVAIGNLLEIPMFGARDQKLSPAIGVHRFRIRILPP